MTNSNLLIDKISASGLKTAYIADKMTISRQSLTNKIKGKTQFTTKEIKALCSILNIGTPDELYEIFFKE